MQAHGGHGGTPATIGSRELLPVTVAQPRGEPGPLSAPAPQPCEPADDPHASSACSCFKPSPQRSHAGCACPATLGPGARVDAQKAAGSKQQQKPPAAPADEKDLAFDRDDGREVPRCAPPRAHAHSQHVQLTTLHNTPAPDTSWRHIPGWPSMLTRCPQACTHRSALPRLRAQP
jgi:hypothetical protein